MLLAGEREVDGKLKILKCGTRRARCRVCGVPVVGSRRWVWGDADRAASAGAVHGGRWGRGAWSVRWTARGGAAAAAAASGAGAGARLAAPRRNTCVPHPTALRPVWLWVSELLCSPTRPDRTRPRANRKSATDGREPSRVSTSHDSSRPTRARTPGARNRAAKPEAGSGPHRDGTGSGPGPVGLQLVVWQSLTRFQAAA